MQRSSNIKWSELKVGLVVIISVGIIATAVVSFGYLSDLMRPKQPLHALFSDVRGLRTGAPVWLGGVEAGYVKKIRFPTKGERVGIDVEMMVDSELSTLIRSDSAASVRTQGLLGDIYVEIGLGTPTAAPLPPNRPLEGVVPVDIKEVISGSSVTLGELGRALKNVNGMLTKISEGQGSIGRLVTDTVLYDQLTQLATESRSLIQQVEKGEGSAGKLLNDPTLYRRLTSVADRMDNAAKSFEQLGDELRHGEGTVGKLASDPLVYNNLVSSTAKLDRLLGRMEAGEGVAGQLMTNQQMATELTSAIAEFKSASTAFRELADDVKKNPKKYFSFRVF
ncbi:MAG: MCE family protein [Nitrospirae bacterium]|nr:MCE family protein [Nitrospirota bacterium]